MKKRFFSLLLAVCLIAVALPVSVSAKPSSPALKYEDIVVKNGLTMQLLAKDADLSAKVWRDSSGNGNHAAIVGDRWVYDAENGTIGYTSSSYADHHNNTKNKVYVTLPVAAFSENDFFAELVFQPRYVSNGDGIVLCSAAESKYGDYNGDGKRSAFAFGGLQMCVFMPTDNPEGSNGQVRVFYDTKGWYGNPQAKGWTAPHLFGDWAKTGSTLIEEPMTMTVSRARTVSDALYTITTPAMTATKSALSNTDINAVKPYAAIGNAFEVFNGFPADVYAIRVYDRMLTGAEKAQNHFADLAAYLDYDLTVLTGLDSEVRKIVYSLCADLSFREATVQKLNGYIEDARRSASEYDRLYVKDGLLMLLDAFDPSAPSVDLASGRWYSLVGGGVATLRSNGTVTWAKREHGIGYDLTAAEHTAGAAFGTFIDLGTGIVDCSRDYTVEYVAKGMPTTDAAVKDTHNTARVTEKFGPWGGWWFDTSGCRPIYNQYNSDHDWAHKMNWGEALDYNIFGSAKNMPATATFVVTNPSAEVSYFKVLKNGSVLRSYSTNDGDSNKPSQTMYDASYFWIMQNVANTTFCVRVYDRALSEIEIAQNHFADLCAYTGVDVGGFLSIGAEELRRQVYAQTSAFDFGTTASALTAVIEDAIGKYEEYFRLAGSATVSDDGKTVNVSIVTENNPGFNGAVFSVNYNADVLVLTETSFGADVHGMTAESQSYDKDPYTFVIADTQNMYGDLELVSMTFSVRENVGAFAEFFRIDAVDFSRNTGSQGEEGTQTETVGVITDDFYCAGVCGFAYADGQNFITVPDGNGGLVITGYVGSDTNLCIPCTIGGIPVRMIEAGAFSGKSFTSVVIPSTVTRIRQNAFASCDACVYYTVQNPNCVIETGALAIGSAGTVVSGVVLRGFENLRAYVAALPSGNTARYAELSGLVSADFAQLALSGNGYRVVCSLATISGLSSVGVEIVRESTGDVRTGVTKTVYREVRNFMRHVVTEGTEGVTYGDLYLSVISGSFEKGEVFRITPYAVAIDGTVYYGAPVTFVYP